MKISDIHIKLSDEIIDSIKNKQDPNKVTGLLAYCTIIIDAEFVINDLKIINGYKGIFIAMPNRKVATRWKCGHKNPIDSTYCCQCGKKLGTQKTNSDDDQRKFVDIAHPITAECRQLIHNNILEKFKSELKTYSDSKYE